MAKLRFFIDRDADLLHACMGALGDRVKARTADIVIVDYLKAITVDGWKKPFAAARIRFDGQKRLFRGGSAAAVQTAIFLPMPQLPGWLAVRAAHSDGVGAIAAGGRSGK